jgi:hypothetical protein
VKPERWSQIRTIYRGVTLVTLLVTGTAITQGPPEGKTIGNNGAAKSGGGNLSQTGLSRHVVLGGLAQASAKDLLAHPTKHRQRNNATDDEWNKRSLRIGQRSASTLVSTGQINAPAGAHKGIFTPGISFGSFGLGETGTITPSDMALAVGPNHVMQLVNITVGVTDKFGNMFQGFPKSLNDFLGLPPSAFTFDPRAVYDAVNDRFIVVGCCTRMNSTPARSCRSGSSLVST